MVHTTCWLRALLGVVTCATIYCHLSCLLNVSSLKGSPLRIHGFSTPDIWSRIFRSCIFHPPPNIWFCFFHILQFYRAMLCITRTMLSQHVCSSVTRRYSVETAEHVLKLFSLSGSHNILVSPFQSAWQYLYADLPTGASHRVHGIRKHRDFLLYKYLALSRKWFKIEP